MKLELYPNEMVIKASDTVHLNNGNGGIKGKLILTNQRIYFKSSNTDEDDFNLEILPDEIEEVIQFKNRLIFPTGINILTKVGEEIKFLIQRRNDWIEMIVRMC